MDHRFLNLRVWNRVWYRFWLLLYDWLLGSLLDGRYLGLVLLLDRGSGLDHGLGLGLGRFFGQDKGYITREGLKESLNIFELLEGVGATVLRILLQRHVGLDEARVLAEHLGALVQVKLELVTVHDGAAVTAERHQCCCCLVGLRRII